jgi:hypothetical protein
MEASGPPPPEPPQPPPPSGAPSEAEMENTGWRLLGVLLALALAFACAVMVVTQVDIGDTPRCDDFAAVEEERNRELAEGGDGVVECFDGSQAQKVISLVLGWPSAILAGIAALVALFFAATGRQGPLLLRLTGTAIVLGGLSILIGSI